MALVYGIYYQIKPYIPEALRIYLRKKWVSRKLAVCRSFWPIDERAGACPEGWVGWPEGKRFAIVLTHDVEGPKGIEKCIPLSEIEMELGFRSSFNFVAEDYLVPPGLFDSLRKKGFEIGLHGLSHDGNMFKSRRHFNKKANRINRYLKEWNCAGFRSPSMYHNLDWICHLDLVYDSSTFDTDPFEPQPDGVSTIFPFWVPGNHNQKGYVELPYTLPQDHALFIIMGEKNIDIWKQKLDWIVERGGMVLLIVHPDYLNLNTKGQTRGEYPATYFTEFLEYIKNKYEGQYWHVLPKEMARFWANNYVNKKG